MKRKIIYGIVILAVLSLLLLIGCTTKYCTSDNQCAKDEHCSHVVGVGLDKCRTINCGGERFIVHCRIEGQIAHLCWSEENLANTEWDCNKV